MVSYTLRGEAMNILLIGGFLGSGKTTIIRSLVRGLTNAGLTCALIENEVGQVGMDDLLIDQPGLQVTQLFGGCVCCQISGDLIEALGKIEDQIAPDWVVVEMSGLAMLSELRSTIGQYGRPSFQAVAVTVVDLSRFHLLITALEPVFDHQAEGADIAFLNKADVSPPTRKIFQIVEGKTGGAVVRVLGEGDKDPDALWALFEGCRKQIAEELKA